MTLERSINSVADVAHAAARGPSPARGAAAGALHFALALIVAALLGGCGSLHHYAVNRLGDSLAKSGTTFAGDDDPELIRAAAPFSLKLMESLLRDAPEHVGLLTATAAGFTEYSYAFIEEDADELEAHDLEASLALHARARSMYVRARDYGMRALDVRHKGFSARLRETHGTAASELDQGDAPAIYWTAAAWAASISLDKDSPASIAELPLVDALLKRLEALDADYERGALDSVLMSWEAARPGRAYAEKEVRRHFDRALELSSGEKAGPYVTYAETHCVHLQDRKAFEANLQQALAIDPARHPQWQLENRVVQRRARWLLTQTDQLFLEPAPGESQ
jgi:predicted anti-sigma-YlaC factor YlaD